MFVFSNSVYQLLVKPEESEVATNAAIFTYLLTPGLIPFVLYRIFTSYLVSQSAVYYPMAIGVIANILNVVLNFALVSGIGYVAFGFVGAPIATSIARGSLLLMALLALWWRGRKSKVEITSGSSIWDTFKEIIRWSGLREFIYLAIPAILMLCFEAWGFQANAILVVKLGEKSQTAHAIVAHLVIVSFMLPLAVSSATSVRVGQRLGAQDAKGAKFVCWLGIIVAISLTLINGVIMIATKGVISKLFIEDDEAVRVHTENIIPIAAF
jgi:MATE family multidrug resistance protein